MILDINILTATGVLRRRRRGAGGPADIEGPLVVVLPRFGPRRQQRLPAVHGQTTRVIIVNYFL